MQPSIQSDGKHLQLYFLSHISPGVCRGWAASREVEPWSSRGLALAVCAGGWRLQGGSEEPATKGQTGRKWVSPKPENSIFSDRIAVSWNSQEAADLEMTHGISSFLDGEQSSQTGFRNELNRK